MAQKRIVAGIDVGGTKCAVSVGEAVEGFVRVLANKRFPTPPSPQDAINAMVSALQTLLDKMAAPQLEAIGISCGGPLDSQRGLILSPPNLPGWDHVDILTPFLEAFNVPVGLQNDANAGALAEHRWGAGRGYRNVVFLTFGTGMGAGLILDGRLYLGTNNLAGEVGHIRLEKDGPIGYGKAGSFEGFCSGSGISQIARTLAEEQLQVGMPALFCRREQDLEKITAKKVGDAALQGDPLAVKIFDNCANQLGKGLAILVDLLNPERIIIGSMYGRYRSLLEPLVLQVLEAEALPQSLSVCKVVPAGLGENIGDLASLSVAIDILH